MSREKNKYLESVRIFFAGIKLYFMNIDKFLNYMTFPIFGQLFGLVIIFVITYFYANNLAEWTAKNPLFDNVFVALILLLVLTVPAFFLFCKAFYDYLIAMAALNSISYTLTTKKGAKNLDTRAHNEVINRRAFSFIFMVICLNVVYIIGSIPFFWVLLVAFGIYSCLSFQVFAFEDGVGPIGAIKRSFMLIKHNFWATTLLLALLFAFSYLLFPMMIVWALDKVDFVYFCANIVENYVKMLPLDVIATNIHLINPNYILEPYEIARYIVSTVISTIVIAYTLPLRSCCCTFLYKTYDDEKIEEARKATKLDGRDELKKVMKREKRTRIRREKYSDSQE